MMVTKTKTNQPEVKQAEPAAEAHKVKIQAPQKVIVAQATTFEKAQYSSERQEMKKAARKHAIKTALWGIGGVLSGAATYLIPVSASNPATGMPLIALVGTIAAAAITIYSFVKAVRSSLEYRGDQIRIKVIDDRRAADERERAAAEKRSVRSA